MAEWRYGRFTLHRLLLTARHGTSLTQQLSPEKTCFASLLFAYLSLAKTDVCMFAFVAGASSALVFYVLFKLSPYLSSAYSNTYTGLCQKDRVDWDSRLL